MSVSATSAVIKIEDCFGGHDKSVNFCGKFYEPYVDVVLIPEAAIRERTAALAADIQSRLAGRPLRMLCVLKGSFRFFTILFEELCKLRARSDLNPIFVEFIRAKSYVNTQSTNSIQVSGLDSLERLENEHLLLVEDVIDTGATLSELVTLIRRGRPASVSVASMLVKRVGSTFKADFVGFDIPNRFVIGFGLDYNEHFRDLNHVCVINKAGVDKFKR